MDFASEDAVPPLEVTDAALEHSSVSDSKPEEVVSVEQEVKSIEEAMVAKEEGNR